MNITWFGQSCFQITAQRIRKNYSHLNLKSSSGSLTDEGSSAGQAKLVIDPFGSEVGFKIPKLDPDILLLTSKDFDSASIKKEVFLIDEPGEYEVKDIFIKGIPLSGDPEEKKKLTNNIYTIEAEEISICHLGFSKEKELSNGEIEKIGNVDILMVPVGGNSTMDAQAASKIISQIEPRIVIPMCYHIPKLKVKLDKLDNFLKIMGKGAVKSENKFSIKKKNLPKEGTEIVILKP